MTSKHHCVVWGRHAPVLLMLAVAGRDGPNRRRGGASSSDGHPRAAGPELSSRAHLFLPVFEPLGDSVPCLKKQNSFAKNRSAEAEPTTIT